MEVLDAKQLTGTQLLQWEQLLANAPVESPFLSSTFATVLSKYRPSIKVVVLPDGAGFIPVDILGNRAQALGMRFADFQGGVFAGPESVDRIEAKTLLRALAVKSYHFDHQLPCKPFTEFATRRIQSPYLDLAHGYSHYVRLLRERGSSIVSQIGRKRRKLAREVGEIRIELDSRSPEVLEWIIQQKNAQRERTRTFDILQFDWIKQALHELLAFNEPAFSTVTAALYVGDQLVAAHFSPRTRTAMHYWFTAYDQTLSKYSPGLILLLESAQHCASQGIERLDLGRGDERYKRRLATGETTILRGTIDLNPVRRWARRSFHAAADAVRATPFASNLKRPFRVLKNMASRRAVRPSEPPND